MWINAVEPEQGTDNTTE